MLAANSCLPSAVKVFKNYKAAFTVLFTVHEFAVRRYKLIDSNRHFHLKRKENNRYWCTKMFTGLHAFRWI